MHFRQSDWKKLVRGAINMYIGIVTLRFVCCWVCLVTFCLDAIRFACIYIYMYTVLKYPFLRQLRFSS